ncbi:prostaglandin reductase 1-like [Neodiprion virginianus]|uniref:Prostaglandin reductase 1 n=1 Tax=Neodiprion lecontei TaxID=441921 RepID=A0A6J0C2Z3_NEOLC|nr:prostaglandin reductase 1 [Neodiprion lecontei]XP_046424288.1 prostaglandin reductase 1-like [Neodiprion fabricii]XP_046617859.1 prostaglandin reductase 1-like [Neodiprion virginianus]
MVIAKKYVLAKHFEGEPKRSDLPIVEEELPPLKDGEYLIQAEYLSVDPYMRVYAQRYPVGITMIGIQVGKIIESKHKDFPVGKHVVATVGWRSHTIINGNAGLSSLRIPDYILPDLGSLPVSLGVGVLGMPGNTAYFGLIELCQPKAGETLVVSGAAGGVGSHVGQIGKILGMKVIGIAGSDAKCKWLKEELGFDYAINYKTQDVAVALKEAAPNKVDCYFDNVGGEISSIVMNHMNLFGRVSACGSISSYNADVKALPKCSIVQPAVVFSQLKVEGFIVNRWADRWMEGIEKNLQWLKENKLKYRETVTEGFENMFDAFVEMMRGDNVGKAVIKV